MEFRVLSASLRSVCVFCGSAPGRLPVHEEHAVRLGEAVARAGMTLVYGGGGIGLMGACARAALAQGGRVIGVIPTFLRTPEVALEDAELQEVASMHERKLSMFEQSDAFVVLPGGIGTLEETIELLSWARLNLHRKPIVLLDVQGYWQPLLALIDHTVAEGFTPAEFRDLYRLAKRAEDVLPLLDREGAGVDGQAPPLALT